MDLSQYCIDSNDVIAYSHPFFTTNSMVLLTKHGNEPVESYRGKNAIRKPPISLVCSEREGPAYSGVRDVQNTSPHRIMMVL